MKNRFELIKKMEGVRPHDRKSQAALDVALEVLHAAEDAEVYEALAGGREFVGNLVNYYAGEEPQANRAAMFIFYYGGVAEG